ncbi:ABC transporter ATP-binding protein [Phormidium tenue FACHB-886]|nr:ABC transporter ATP-binding protein [Phormidium tenue FACHB-886]
MFIKFSLARRLLRGTKFWNDNSLILRELQYFPRTAILAIVFPLLAAAFEGFGIGFLLAFLQSLISPGAEPFRTGFEWFDIWILGVNTSEESRLYRASALILITTWLRAGFSYLMFIYMEFAQLHLIDRLRRRVFEQLQSLSLEYFGKARSGEIINSLTLELNQLKQVLNYGSYVITKGLVLLVYTMVMVQISWQLSIVSILLFGLLAVGLSNLSKRVREPSFEVSKANGRFTSIAVEFINGIRTVQAFSTQDFERRRYYEASTATVKTAKRTVMLWTVIRPLAEGLATTILVGMIVVGITVFVANGSLQAASLLTFIFVLFRLVPAIHEINGNIAQIFNFHGSLENIKALLREDDKPYFHNGSVPLEQFNHSIEFASVDFGYDSATLILHNINLSICKGEIVALVGASGAGKTTLADLVPRFYDPTAGKILLDGADLRDFDIHTLRRKMAIVSQDTFIFNTTVRDNIAYGSEGATDTAIMEASRLANALDFIKDLPEGFETELGDRGVRLSGGQRQRIAIARALLRDPEILILDEATSALDSESERLIQESLEKLSVGRTVIAIAHRLSTIVRADKIIVLEQGRIVEQGKYQELLEQRGKLWKYHQMQHNFAQTSSIPAETPTVS